MGFDANNGFSIACAGFGRMQKCVCSTLGFNEIEIEKKDWSKLNQDDIVLEFLNVDDYWDLPNEKCLPLAKRLEEFVNQINSSYQWDVKDLIRALKKTHEDGENFLMF